MHKVISEIQVMIYRREWTPIRDREEVSTELLLRITELHKSKEKWRRYLIELAAYAIFAVASDQSEEKAHG